MAVPSGKQGIGADPKERRNEAGAVAGLRLCVWASYRVSHQGRWHPGHSGYVPVAKSIWNAVLLQCRNYSHRPQKISCDLCIAASNLLHQAEDMAAKYPNTIAVMLDITSQKGHLESLIKDHDIVIRHNHKLCIDISNSTLMYTFKDQQFICCFWYLACCHTHFIHK